MKITNNDQVLITTKNDEVLGVNLGWDFTAEHEWGIDGIKQLLQIKNKGYGYVRHKISSAEFISRNQVKNYYTISCVYNYNCDKILPIYQNKEVIAAWSDKGFIVGFKDEKIRDKFYHAFLKEDVCVTLEGNFGSSNNPFSRAGLKLLIISQLPDNLKKEWITLHKYQEHLEKTVKKTGIHERLEKANKRYYALSPRLDKNNKLQFFLNPREQDKYHFGWFTVEELDQWIKNEGPILKCLN